ncbi:cytochrome P450 [Tsukamurella sp. 8F]|uniref:cytochrome P450 n=1 Tax=unclassified Tsukamurella TaxID=2633480 RepID=UPI0023B9ABA3|nr:MULTISPECIES: cytochrome P450 [unclassified Tsukamurella]MDF0529489.1 cytochrome P450 [Tsukamurella sp. 8J]MDF0585823.1 cytochrome P450 [Tsukamurella sp. 8F]
MTETRSDGRCTPDVFGAGFAFDPHPSYAAMRATTPAYRHPQGFWVLTRYADVAALQRSGHSVDERNLRHIPDFKSDSRTLGTANRMMSGLSMLDRDVPEHDRLRGVAAAAFTTRAVAARAARIGELVAEALDRIQAVDTADVIAELAFPLPFTLISEILGVPPVASDRMRDLIAVLVLGLEPSSDPTLQARIRDANDTLTDTTAEMVARKRANRGDDLLTRMIDASDDGVLSGSELVAQVMFLYIAGHETTANLIAGGIATLLEHPEQAGWLRRRPEAAPNAVEEILRYAPSVHLMRRITVEPLAVADREIPPGSFVIGSIASANRDPEVWGPDAGVLCLDRLDARRHLSFGAGVHHCLGAALARAEARCALVEFVRRFPTAEPVDMQWNRRINLRGPSVLTVRTAA